MVKTLPIKRETQLRSLGQEDPLEKGMAKHSRKMLEMFYHIVTK